MGASLFTYGTLMFPPVVRRLAGRALATQPAVLDGFARHALRGARYPGLVPAPDARVAGVLVHGVWPALLAKLDRWEGDEYVRACVRVATPGGYARAWVYVLAPTARERALPRDWDPDAFARRHLARWQRGAARFRAREIARR